MSVIGTAGHIDHGKSTLVKAITGIDPDRLQEEKDRGMTIDLGFAWLSLPSGKEASIVDVPGHEGFIKNMLAGVGGIDLALLVVAADDGIMPQTREHLAILDLLYVNKGIVVVTKKDLVDREWLELVISDIEETVKPTFLAGAPIISVSSTTGEGIPGLLTAIDNLLEKVPPKRDIGRPRLPIDRMFTVAGFGTIVTGTLIDGQLSVGQDVTIVPGKEKARIRGLQTHRQKVNTAFPGTRVAVNLAGLSVQELERGRIVTRSGWLGTTSVFDARIIMTADAPSSLIHGAGITVHLLTSSVPGRARLLDSDILEPGQTGYAQIRLSESLAVIIGDRFIIRNGAGTIGGGEVVDPHPRRHRRFDSTTLEALSAINEGVDSMILSVLMRSEPCEFKDIAGAVALSTEELKTAVSGLSESGRIILLGNEDLDTRTVLVSEKGWQKILEQAEDALRNYHRQYPLRVGMSKEELRSKIHRSGRLATRIVDRMIENGRLTSEKLIEGNNLVKLASHEVVVSPQHQASINSFLAAFRATPYKPPTDLQSDPEIINYLIELKTIIRLPTDELLLETHIMDDMVDRVLKRIGTEGQVSLVEVRDMFDTTRSYAFALLEYLDYSHRAKRVGSTLVRL